MNGRPTTLIIGRCLPLLRVTAAVTDVTSRKNLVYIQNTGQ